MDIKNLLSSLGLSSQSEKPAPSQYFPADIITNLEQESIKENSNMPSSPQNFGGLSIQSLLPILLLAISGKSNFNQILSKVASLSPELKNLEPLTKLLSTPEKPSSPSIDSYKRIE